VTSEAPAAAESPTASVRDALLAEIKKSKVVFYNTVVAQAQTVEVSNDRVTFTFSPAQRALREVFEQNRSWLESVARQVGKRRMTVESVQAERTASPSRDAEPSPEEGRKAALREQALADAGVQALLEVFPGEIRDVEEM
jgi:hypothetical protein